MTALLRPHLTVHAALAAEVRRADPTLENSPAPVVTNCPAAISPALNYHERGNVEDVPWDDDDRAHGWQPFWKRVLHEYEAMA